MKSKSLYITKRYIYAMKHIKSMILFLCITFSYAVCQDSLNIKTIATLPSSDMGGYSAVRSLKNKNKDYCVCAWSGFGDAKLKIFNTDNKKNPVLASQISLKGAVTSLFTKDDYLYVGENIMGMEIIDISDLASPKIVGFYDSPGSVCDIFVLDNNAYIADDDRGLQIINISSPTSPVVLGTYKYEGTKCKSVCVQNSLAFFASSYAGLIVLNISNPATLQLIAKSDSIKGAENVFISGTFAYVTCWTSTGPTLYSIDVSKPSAPAIKGTYTVPGYAKKSIKNDNYLFIGSDSGIYVTDITKLDLFILKGKYTQSNIAYDLDVCQNYIYSVNLKGEFRILLFDPPTLIATPHNIVLNTNSLVLMQSKIIYKILKQEKINVSIYSINGKHRSTLIDGIQKPGFYTHDISSLPAGAYLVNLSTENKNIIKKLTILR